MNLQDVWRDLESLLALQHDVVGPLVGKKLRDKQLTYTVTFAQKLFQHAATSLQLAPGVSTKLDGRPVSFTDWPSLQVLARASLETYLVFHYLYMQPLTRDDQACRYFAWMLAGTLTRQAFPALEEAQEDQLRKEAKLIELLRTRIKKTSAFDALTPGRKKEVLAGRRWHPDTTLTRLSGLAFGFDFGPALYKYLSGPVHAGALSVVQVRKTRTESEVMGMATAALIPTTTVLSAMTEAFANKFVACRKVLNCHPTRELNRYYATFSYSVSLKGRASTESADSR